MPGILRGVARTAVVAGTATAVSNNVSRRQQTRWANQTQQSSYQQQQAYAAQQQAYAEQVAAQQAYAQQQAAAQAAAQQAAAQQAAAQQAAAPQPTDLVAELKSLADLKAVGALTDAEFEAAKAKLLGS